MRNFINEPREYQEYLQDTQGTQGGNPSLLRSSSCKIHLTTPVEYAWKGPPGKTRRDLFLFSVSVLCFLCIRVSKIRALLPTDRSWLFANYQEAWNFYTFYLNCNFNFNFPIFGSGSKCALKRKKWKIYPLSRYVCVCVCIWQILRLHLSMRI